MTKNLYISLISLAIVCFACKQAEVEPAPAAQKKPVDSDTKSRENDNEVVKESTPQPRKEKPETQKVAEKEVDDKCLDGDYGNFIDPGEYADDNTQAPPNNLQRGFRIYMPIKANDNCKVPLLAFAMGTAMPAGWYTDFYTHLQSHGFAVVVDPNPMAISGDSLKEAITYAHSKFGDRLIKATGTIGHSQGGAGALNASNFKRDGITVEAVVGLMPGQFDFTGNKNAAYLGLGGTNDLFGVFTDPSLSYSKMKGPKFKAIQRNAGHILDSAGTKRGKNFAAMSAAWFSCHLAQNNNSCALFAQAESCSEKFRGEWNCDK